MVPIDIFSFTSVTNDGNISFTTILITGKEYVGPINEIYVNINLINFTMNARCMRRKEILTWSDEIFDTRWQYYIKCKIQNLEFGSWEMDKQFHHILYYIVLCIYVLLLSIKIILFYSILYWDYLSMPGLKLIHISKMSPWYITYSSLSDVPPSWFNAENVYHGITHTKHNSGRWPFN